MSAYRKVVAKRLDVFSERRNVAVARESRRELLVERTLLFCVALTEPKHGVIRSAHHSRSFFGHRVKSARRPKWTLLTAATTTSRRF
jgi:hypothetical protein